jgi:cyclic pyranopterin phosphate synthase
MSASVQLPVIHALRPMDAERAASLAPATARPASTGGQRRLIDSHGRTIQDLRLSITDRCNFRCVYCMDPDVRFIDQRELLTPAEMQQIVRACVRLGVERVRITGGEPTLHPELTRIIGLVAELGVRDISMTTNGALITQALLDEWKGAGLRRITFSLDSLSPETFSAMTRSACTADRVRQSIALAIDAGLGPVKVNAVVIRGRNEEQIPRLTLLAREMGFEMRFIEYMPLDSGRRWGPELLVTAQEILRRAREAGELTPLGRDFESSTSETYAFADAPADSPARVGIIAPVTRAFCGRCSRLRITADGKVRPCLFSLAEHDVRGVLRAGGSETEIEDFLLDSVWSKQAGHGINAPDFEQPSRPMSAIGG